MAKKKMSDTAVCRNRKAGYQFQVIERIECGLVLRGSEVKSLRERNVSIDEAYANIVDDELWLIGCHIHPYKYSQSRDLEPLRRRKLLVKARELHKLKTRIALKGFTLVPLSIYFNEKGIAKVSVGVARGKKTGDKREDLRARDHKREIDRAMQRRN